MMIAGLPTELVLIDSNQAKAEEEAMDLSHAAAFIKPITTIILGRLKARSASKRAGAGPCPIPLPNKPWRIGTSVKVAKYIKKLKNDQ
jgi:hypothetical protein